MLKAFSGLLMARFIYFFFFGSVLNAKQVRQRVDERSLVSKRTRDYLCVTSSRHEKESHLKRVINSILIVCMFKGCYCESGKEGEGMFILIWRKRFYSHENIGTCHSVLLSSSPSSHILCTMMKNFYLL